MQESIMIPVSEQDQLHLMRIYENPKGTPVFLLHGSVENGKIFYSASGKGFAFYLANQGYDVYVGDLRGRGKSTPKINKNSEYGQTEAITEDIPAFIQKICDIRGDVPQMWGAHSWGGVLLSSYLARFPEKQHLVKGMVCFGVKRMVEVKNFKKTLQIDLFWKTFAQVIAKVFGYLPALEMKIGSDNETRKSLREGASWVKKSAWIDPSDSFNYGKAIKKIEHPATLFLTGANDTCLGNPEDVQLFMSEVGGEKNVFRTIGKKQGYKYDYDHIDLITHPEASIDHFPEILNWMQTTFKSETIP
jgi:predicted alpha/beta hydrolase